eukprot:scaffold73052_cov103-Phaeocystis_antarctica.AAC.6
MPRSASRAKWHAVSQESSKSTTLEACVCGHSRLTSATTPSHEWSPSMLTTSQTTLGLAAKKRGMPRRELPHSTCNRPAGKRCDRCASAALP